MRQNKNYGRYWDIVMAAFSTLVLIIIVGLSFDYFYEFNDDVLMKDILAGVYTGTPEGLNIQMQAPISALIAMLYKIAPSCAWYGFFLCFMHYGCLFLLNYRATTLMNRAGSKILVNIIITLVFAAISLPHLVMAQYTITVAIMAATASFWFYTIPENLTLKQFASECIMPVIIIAVAFMVRSEMLLLMMPYVGIAGLVRWNKEKKMFTRDNCVRYLGAGLAILLGIGVGFAGNKIGYASAEWKEFYNLFDNRTQLYDYQYIPDYEENKAFYDSIGIKESQYNLLVNYDYAIDDKIDAKVLGQVAEYAASLRDDSVVRRLPWAVKTYLYRIIHFSDEGYSVTVFFLYIMVVIAVMARKESEVKHKIKILILRIGGLFLARSVPWLYIILGRRAPDRIVHSLYIIEIVILGSFLIVEGVSRLKDRGFIMMFAAVVLFVGTLLTMPILVRNLNSHIEKQEQINSYAAAIDEYCSQNPDNFYFEDVYSTIRDGESFNQKMFVDVDNSMTNYDLLGGWAAGSPLFVKKLAAYGVDSVGTDLIEKDNLFIINDMEYSTDWIVELYADKGIQVEVEQTDTIANIFGVYKVRKSND